MPKSIKYLRVEILGIFNVQFGPFVPESIIITLGRILSQIASIKHTGIYNIII